MKLFLATLLLSFSMISNSAPTDGKIFYKTSNGELVSRDVTLDVPARGIGKVSLSGQNFEWKTKNFWTVKKNGQTIFIAAFRTEFMDKKSTLLFKGTYLKGSNKIMYYGNFYKAPNHMTVFKGHDFSNFTFKGGFKFQHDN